MDAVSLRSYSSASANVQASLRRETLTILNCNVPRPRRTAQFHLPIGRYLGSCAAGKNQRFMGGELRALGTHNAAIYRRRPGLWPGLTGCQGGRRYEADIPGRVCVLTTLRLRRGKGRYSPYSDTTRRCWLSGWEGASTAFVMSPTAGQSELIRTTHRH